MDGRDLAMNDEAMTAKAVEDSRDDPGVWDFENPHEVSRGDDAMAVLSVSVTLSRFIEIRGIANEHGMSLSELMQAALDAYMASTRPVAKTGKVRSA